MNKYYRLDYKDIEFYHYNHDSKTNEDYFKKSKQSGSLYLEKTDSFIYKGMICNYRNILNSSEGIRIREDDEYLIIEPSEIILSKDNLKEISKEDITEDYNNDLNDIGINTFICNFINTNELSELEIVPYDLVLSYKDYLFIVTQTNQSFLTPFNFMVMFSYLLNKNNNNSFNKDYLYDFLINEKEKPIYLRLLWNIEVYNYENINLIPEVDRSIELLNYIGILHPDYKNTDTNDIIIDNDNIVYFRPVINDIYNTYPEINMLTKDYILYNNKRAKSTQKINVKLPQKSEV